MKSFKGCINKNCSAYNNRIKYKDLDNYCTKCGSQIYYVCEDCWKQLDHNKSHICTECEENKRKKKQERIDKIQDGAKKVGKAAIAIGGAAVTVAKHAKDVEGAAKDVAKVAKGAFKIIKKK